MSRTKRSMCYSIVLILLLTAAVFSGITIMNYYRERIRMEKYSFTESARELHNPERGFYNLYCFMITDEEADYEQFVQDYYSKDRNTSLALIEINLQNYRDCEISEAGLKNMTALFRMLNEFDKQIIVRFLYDWHGEIEKYEPDSMDIILRHMEQAEYVLREFSSKIFVVQGLFIGNWGEMNGTKYTGKEDWSRLAGKLSSVTEQSTYLAVRTPSQWRDIVGYPEISETEFGADSLAVRMSLFNDGILGNESDYGTYRIQETDRKGEFHSRTEELIFQERLCAFVPNGGEVIHDNPYNDFDHAIKDMATMHVTYLNQGYDQEVLDKWKRVKVTGSGCYSGMDGYTYIERHLGYRLLIDSVDLRNDLSEELVEISINMKNVGFAPLYDRTEADLLFYSKESGESFTCRLRGDLRQLTGGNASDELLSLKAEIDVKDLSCTEYDVFFSLVYPKTGQRIVLANEQEMGEFGYGIARIEIYDLLQYLSYKIED